MKKFVIVLVSVIVFSSGIFLTSAYSEVNNMMLGSTNMCTSMMNTMPQDVIIKTISSQMVSVGEESTVTLLVLDKETEKPLDEASVILHIEKGGPMEMFEAENIGSGKYVIPVNVDEKGYYTMHTHAIPEGKSMMSMMNNHMDIGIIAR